MKYILICLLLTSCLSTRKATDYLEQKGELPRICADKYPVRDSVIIKDSVTLDTLYVGEVVTDTVWIGGLGQLDSNATDATTPLVPQRIITKTLPAKVITKTQIQVKEIYRENTARVAALTNEIGALKAEMAKKDAQIADLQADRDGWKKKAKQRWWWIIALVVFAFRRQIIGGIGGMVKHWAG